MRTFFVVNVQQCRLLLALGMLLQLFQCPRARSEPYQGSFSPSRLKNGILMLSYLLLHLQGLPQLLPECSHPFSCGSGKSLLLPTVPERTTICFSESSKLPFASTAGCCADDVHDSVDHVCNAGRGNNDDDSVSHVVQSDHISSTTCCGTLWKLHGGCFLFISSRVCSLCVIWFMVQAMPFACWWVCTLHVLLLIRDIGS